MAQRSATLSTGFLRRRARLGIFGVMMGSALVLAGCGGPASRSALDGDDELPDSILVQILVDLHWEDARQYLEARDAEWPSIVDGTPVFATAGIQDSVLAAHEVTKTEFDKRIETLLDDPDRFLALYQRVLDVVNVRASRQADRF